MRRTPTQADIYAAELKLSRSQQDIRERLVRTQQTARKGLERMAGIAIVAGVVGVSIIWLLARRPKVVPATRGAYRVRTTSALGLVFAFLLRYVKIGMPLIVQQIRKAQSRPAVSKRVLTPDYSDVNYTSNRYRH